MTGGGRGIGRAIATDLLRAGARVVIGDLNEAEMTETCAALERFGSVDWVELDVSSTESIQKAVGAIADEHGAVDVLVNNAGIGKPGLFIEQDPRLIAKTIAIDLVGALEVTRAVLPHMLASGWGRIANISSMMAVTGSPGFAVYSAAKSGMLGFSEALERELRSFPDVRVTAVLPPSVRTRAFEEAKHTEPELMRWSLVPPVSVEQVARRTVRGLISGRKRVYCGIQSFLVSMTQRLLPFLMDRILMFMFRPPPRQLPSGRPEGVASFPEASSAPI